MHALVDPFDPRYINFDHGPHFIWGDPHGEVLARVDAEDYGFLSQWCWGVTWDKHGRKPYLRRTGSDNGRSFTIYLHKVVMERKGVVQPPHHIIADHEDGDTLNCTRANLHWATPSMNRKNIRGQRSMRL